MRYDLAAVFLAAVLSLAAQPGSAQGVRRSNTPPPAPPPDASVPNAADCPVAADLAGGIRLTSDLNETETIRLEEDGSFIVRFEDAEGFGVVMRLVRGLYLTRSWPIDEGQVDFWPSMIVNFPVSDAEMPDPVPGEGWDVDVRLGGSDFADEGEEQSYSFGEPDRIAFGDCIYDYIPVTAVYIGAGDPFQDVYYYLTEFGVSYLAESGPVDAEPDLFTNHIRIEAEQ